MLLKGAPAQRALRLLQRVSCRNLPAEVTSSSTRGLHTVPCQSNGFFKSLLNGVNAHVTSQPLTVRGFADQATPRPKSRTRQSSTNAVSTRKGAKTKGGPRKVKKRTAKPKRRPKAKPSPEQKKKTQVKELKKLLLKPPKQLPQTAYTVLVTELTTSDLAQRGKEAASKYRGLSPSEREGYNHTANENKSKNQEAYREWIRSFPPIDIKRSNDASKRLVQLGVKKRPMKLKDDRLPKRPTTAVALFLRDRYASGDMAGLPAKDATKLISQEWNNLSTAQKQEYLDAQARDRKRYDADVNRIFGA